MSIRNTGVSGIKAFTITNVISGTPVQGPDYVIPSGVSVVVRAHPDNTGTIYVAESSTNAVKTSTDNIPLVANQAQDFYLTNSNRLYFDASVSGEKVLVSFEYAN